MNNPSQTIIHRPKSPCGAGALVLAGSSGRVDSQRAKVLAQAGVVALPLQWFGGDGLQPGPWEVPIETFSRALDSLAPEVDRLVVVGTSFGAEAALVTATLDSRVDAVAAFAPSSVVWAGYDELKQRYTSHWTHAGVPLDYLSLVAPEKDSTGIQPSYVSWFEKSLSKASEDELERATIPVESIPEVLLISGGDDQVWPSVRFARDIVDRRVRHGLKTVSVTSEQAGHRTVLPGEEPPASGARMQRGGNSAADQGLGHEAWAHLGRLLRTDG